jgi:hypothetical protein
MQNRNQWISPSAARNAIKRYLDDPKTRTEIQLLSLTEVNSYIDMLEKMKQKAQDIINAAFTFFSSSAQKHFGQGRFYDSPVCTMKYGNNVFIYNCDSGNFITPTPLSIEECDDLLFELGQRKQQIERIQCQEDRIIRNKILKKPLAPKLVESKPATHADGTKSLDDDEVEKKEETLYAQPAVPQDEEDSMVLNAQDTIALEALGMYQNLFDAHRVLSTKCNVLETQDAEKTKLLTQLFTQNENLKKDVESTQEQLRDSSKLITVLQLQNNELKEKNQTIASESKQEQSSLGENLRSVQSKVDELQAKVLKFESTDLMQENQKLQENASFLQSKLAKLTEAEEKLTGQLKDNISSIQTLQAQFSSLAEENKKLMVEIQTKQQLEAEKKQELYRADIPREDLEGLLTGVWPFHKTPKNQPVNSA